MLAQLLPASRPDTCREFRVAPGRVLRTTPIFDTYWQFATERQEMFFRRCLGLSAPWTEDQVLRAFRFTNVYRASDRVSQYLIRHVIYGGFQSEEDICFRTILFKLFNRIETWELLESTLGVISWKNFDITVYERILDGALNRGSRIYSAAYIMPTPPFGDKRKHLNHLRLLDKIMKDRVPSKIASAKSLHQVFNILRSYPSVGDFLAFQYCIDLNYSQIMDFSEMDFVIAGPGARSGIRKTFTDTAGLNDEDVIRAVAELSDQEFKRRELRFRSLWGRPLQLIDCQNLFCEVDKYARVMHPEANGGGRSRIKQRFTPSKRPFLQWYPPKWSLTVPQADAWSNIAECARLSALCKTHP